MSGPLIPATTMRNLALVTMTALVDQKSENHETTAVVEAIVTDVVIPVTSEYVELVVLTEPVAVALLFGIGAGNPAAPVGPS